MHVWCVYFNKLIDNASGDNQQGEPDLSTARFNISLFFFSFSISASLSRHCARSVSTLFCHFLPSSHFPITSSRCCQHAPSCSIVFSGHKIISKPQQLAINKIISIIKSNYTNSNCSAKFKPATEGVQALTDISRSVLYAFAGYKAISSHMCMLSWQRNPCTNCKSAQ